MSKNDKQRAALRVVPARPLEWSEGAAIRALGAVVRYLDTEILTELPARDRRQFFAMLREHSDRRLTTMDECARCAARSGDRVEADAHPVIT